MELLDNPAGRLYYWLAAADGQPGNEPALKGWCAVFDLDPSKTASRIELFRFAGCLAELAQQTRYEVTRLSPDAHPDLLLKHFPQVEQALAQFAVVASKQMQQFLQPLEATGWHGLEYIASLLHSGRPERWIGEEQQEDLLQQVRDLINDVIADEHLERKGKDLIVARLRDVEEALLMAKLQGVNPIATAADSFLGGILRRGDLGINFLRTETGTKVASLIFSIATLLGMGADYLALTDGQGQPVIEQTTSVTVNVSNTDESP